MIEVKERPLMTFMQLGYNQEAFIRESIEGAFAQDYSPLEIILSDNASTDGTFEVMKSMAAAYRGPHQIRLNRNEVNRGVSQHVNKAVSMARGELVFFCAGDDVSLPNRVSRVVEVWEAGGRRAYSLYSNSTLIDARGQVLGLNHKVPQGCHARTIEEVVRRKSVTVPGAEHAYRRSLFEKYGPLPATHMWDDEPVSFRSLLEGEITYIDEPLLLYRLHTENLSFNSGRYPSTAAYRSARLRLVLGWIEVMDSWIADLRKWEVGREAAERADVERWVRELERHKRFLGVEVAMLQRHLPAGVLLAARSLRCGLSVREAFQNLGRSWIQPYWRAKLLRWARGASG